jgi:hypothetical protein
VQVINREEHDEEDEHQQPCRRNGRRRGNAVGKELGKADEPERDPPDGESVGDGADGALMLWVQHVAALSWFADYPAQTGREIPMVRLTAKPGDAA